jgi:predicted nucleic acid-binding protein
MCTYICINALTSHYPTKLYNYAIALHQKAIIYKLASESEILGFDQDTAKIASEIYCDLRHRGLLIPPIDIFIGATAIQHDLVLVTANIKQFQIMKNLKYINWMTHS